MIDNVQIFEGDYMPDDVLVPRRPNIDWGGSDHLALSPEQMNAPGVSFAGGFLPSDNVSSFSSSTQMGAPSAPIDPLLFDLAPARKRRSGASHAALGMLDMVKASIDHDHKIGESAKRANDYDKERMNEDPEGYKIDMDRAIYLSQKAREETDPARKALYGREIRKLLPNETQGLDDLAAAEFLTNAGQYNEKMRLEMLKGENQLRLQGLKNSGALDKTQLQNMTKENVAQLGAATRLEIAQLQDEGRRAIAAGNNQRALEVQQMIADRTLTLQQMKEAGLNDRTEQTLENKLLQKFIDGDIRLAQEGMRQDGQTLRTGMNNDTRIVTTGMQESGKDARENLKADAAMDRVRAQQEGANYRAELSANARVSAAKLGVKQAAPVPTANGNIAPAQGVIDAVALMNANPDVFSATKAMVNNRFGRAVGLVGADEIQMQEHVKQSLAPLVRDSVQQLMALFPKGGSGVINTAKEQEFFVPVAEAISSGERNRIIPAITSFYGNMYDEAAKMGEPKIMSRQDFIDLMMTGKKPAGMPANAGQQVSGGATKVRGGFAW